MDNEGIVRQIEKLAIPLLASEGFALIDIELKKEAHGLVLRFFIDREGGVDLDACGKASGFLGDLIDEKDLISSSYILEVASPGIERRLRRPADFKRFAGLNIQVKTLTRIEGRKRFTGLIKEAGEESFTVGCEDLTVEIPYGQVSNAHLVVDLDF